MTAGDDDVLLSPEDCGHAVHVGSRLKPRTVSSSSVYLGVCVRVCERESMLAWMCLHPGFPLQRLRSALKLKWIV